MISIFGYLISMTNLMQMFNFFKKIKLNKNDDGASFEIELTAAVLAYEVARSDGEVSDTELNV